MFSRLEHLKLKWPFSLRLRTAARRIASMPASRPQFESSLQSKTSALKRHRALARTAPARDGTSARGRHDPTSRFVEICRDLSRFADGRPFKAPARRSERAAAAGCRRNRVAYPSRRVAYPSLWCCGRQPAAGDEAGDEAAECAYIRARCEARARARANTHTRTEHTRLPRYASLFAHTEGTDVTRICESDSDT